MKKILLSGGAVLLAVGVYAETISMNFIGDAEASGTLADSDIAGLVGNETGNGLGSTMTANWNNLAGNSSSSSTILGASGNIIGGVLASWSSDNTWSLPNTTSGANTSANTVMMKGYLDNDSENTTSITVSGLEALSGSYSVIVYMDGNNDTNWTRGSYSIGASSVINEDTENTDFNSGSGNNANGLFQIPVEGEGFGNLDWPSSPNNSEGNVIIFSGLTSSSFTLSADPAESGGEWFRAPVNGIQIVGVVPEPATLSLIAVVGGLVMLIRRRFIA